MYSRYSDVSLKNGMWRKIWIHDIEGILMILKSNIPKNEAKGDLPRIEPLASRFLLSDLDFDVLARKFQIKVHKHCTTVYSAYVYHSILLMSNICLERQLILVYISTPFIKLMTITQPPRVQWVVSLLQLKLGYTCDIFTPGVHSQETNVFFLVISCGCPF
jgi:hypothetical protein